MCSVAEQLVHGTTLPDVVLKRVDKLLGGLQSLCIANFRLCAYEDLGTHGAIINSGDIGVDIVRSDGFLMMVHIECGIRRVIVLLKMDRIGQAAHLRRDLEGFLNQINGGPTKETSESFSITLSRLDSARFGLCSMLVEIRLVNILNASIHNRTFIKYCIDIMFFDYDGLSLVVVPKLVEQFPVWVLSVVYHGVIPLFTAFIELMVEDGGIPVRIACPDHMW